ncbi:FMN-linked oxidoreductase [Neolentinus lepideus HHB14362 ss-1]|uniref:FMN-linked oxidoreductase n=1 Tax=Neolentinus lepideus HHB14362 ss-1 TaxID=1314782 RepID=A0A165SZI5_9AGAM|nr:FMN-linked oxidoreductase [Neolentinus lepideus HHB14362 ss-1]
MSPEEPTLKPTPKLFQPKQIGAITLQHRIVLAPLTRNRANKAHVHGPLAIEYYAQRASTPGTLLVTEATFIAPQAGGYPHVPGIWSAEQVAAWKKVVDAVHARGSFVYLQLWALGRQASPEVLAAEGHPPSAYVSSSATPLPGAAHIPRALALAELGEWAGLYAAAAGNAVHGAGFDGVEVHCANGYLLDQFLQDVCNKREDGYGGSVEGRCRFPLEVVQAVAEAVGAERTGVRISPWGTFGGMRMADPRETFSYFVTQLRDRFPGLAYVHVIEPRTTGNVDVPDVPEGDSNDFVRDIWAPRPIISAGGYTREESFRSAEKYDYLIAWGRYWISNVSSGVGVAGERWWGADVLLGLQPDLPYRLLKDIPLTPYSRDLFYNTESPHGYIDYPFAEESAEAEAESELRR